jgi:hypothetical protein
MEGRKAMRKEGKKEGRKKEGRKKVGRTKRPCGTAWNE